MWLPNKALFIYIYNSETQTFLIEQSAEPRILRRVNSLFTETREKKKSFRYLQNKAFFVKMLLINL